MLDIHFVEEWVPLIDLYNMKVPTGQQFIERVKCTGGPSTCKKVSLRPITLKMRF
jgi:hypothetical protein